MATPSLYRRYRPRRFAELKGQDHVVRALRDAVRSGREGQAYLFSGPRGTGKTTSARILAKVLNCENPEDGEPCCQCASCLAVEAGTSYDVHELDAASNNGVDAMRDLIERASLGTPGRHKVYILDEVHMLSRAAEAALLKTLEEPPSHVVFVLATTDPQRVSETIRSRTQHLRFHLLPADTLAAHVRWVADDAGLSVGDHAIDLAVAQGGGSARDTLSALELIVASGDEDDAGTAVLDEFVDALVANDAGRVLTAIATAINDGDDARTVTDRLVHHLRDGFLTLMAPELVQLPSDRADVVATGASALGARRLVRAIEVLGGMLVEMRHAPDPRVLLEVAAVGLCGQGATSGVDQLEERLERLEHAVDALASATPASTPPPEASPTGRAAVGGRARRAAAMAQRTETGDQSAASGAVAAPSAPDDVGTADGGAIESTETVPAAPGAASEPASAEAVQAVWAERVLAKLTSVRKALFATGTVTGSTTADGKVELQFPSDRLRERCDEHRAEIEAVLADELGRPVSLALTVSGGSVPDGPGASSSGAAAVADDDERIDPDDLVDAPEAHHDAVTRLQAAFPGSEVVTDRDQQQ